MLGAVAARVAAGETVSFRPYGNSMTPRIYPGQFVTVEPMGDRVPRLGDIVLCRVRGTIRLHLVAAVEPARRRVLITNNHGYVNGWTSYAKVFGLVTAVA